MYEYSILEDFDIDKDIDGKTTGFGTNFKVIIVPLPCRPKKDALPSPLLT